MNAICRGFCNSFKGTRNGAYPLADERKRRYFPFLEANKVPVYTKDLKYCYKKTYMELPLDLISSKYKGIYRCMFIGEEKDKFHFAIYF